MPLSSVLGAQSLVKPGVCTSSTRPASPFEGQVIYETDTDLVQVYNGSGWRTLGRMVASTNGSVLQVVSTTKTDIFSASLAAGATTDITGLSASITPTSTSSKILVFVSMNGTQLYSGNYYNRTGFQIKRGSTVVGGGTTAGNRTSISAATYVGDVYGNYALMNLSSNYLDSPSTTSATTYQVALFNVTSLTLTCYVNQSGNDGNVAEIGRPSSTITLMEIAG